MTNVTNTSDPFKHIKISLCYENVYILVEILIIIVFRKCKLNAKKKVLKHFIRIKNDIILDRRNRQIIHNK